MSGRVFLDTNVLVYLYDTDAPEKQARARTLLEEHGLAGNAFLSTQVLQEFYVNVARKFARQLSHEEALRATENLSRLPLVQIHTSLILDAISLRRDLQLSFWDALIVRAALEAGCERLLTEDMQPGRRIGELRIENPFLA
jgi:predicted nucleic acid-binding protein